MRILLSNLRHDGLVIPDIGHVGLSEIALKVLGCLIGFRILYKPGLSRGKSAAQTRRFLS